MSDDAAAVLLRADEALSELIAIVGAGLAEIETGQSAESAEAMRAAYKAKAVALMDAVRAADTVPALADTGAGRKAAGGDGTRAKARASERGAGGDDAALEREMEALTVERDLLNGRLRQLRDQLSEMRFASQAMACPQ